MTDEHALSALLNAADAVVSDGVAHARQDDPHRFATLPREFDEGVAMRQLVIDYLANSEMRVSLHLVGYRAGKAHVVQVFATTVRPCSAH